MVGPYAAGSLMGRREIGTPLARHIRGHTDTWGARHGVYYFLGNVPSHVSHARPVYEKIGGTFVVTSQVAYDYCARQGVSVIMLDDRPDIFLQFPKSAVMQTISFLNENAAVVLFYDIFSINKYLKVPQVMLSHGNSFKDFYIEWRQEILPFFDYFAGLGPINEQTLVKKGVAPEKILPIGLARSDEIIKNAGRITGRKFIAKRLGLDHHKPIISYMPTWWGPTSVNDTGKMILRYMPEDYSFIFRPHPSTPQEVIDEYDRIITTEKLNAVYVPDGRFEGVGINEIYAASSLFIGDMSSVVLDAMLTDKPLLFAFGGGDRAQAESVYAPIHELFTASPHVTGENAPRIAEIVVQVLKKPVKKEVYDSANANVTYGLEGNNAQQIISAVKMILERRGK